VKTNHPEVPWFDAVTFNKNQQKFPLEELLKHVGQHIAWSWDGSRIVASGESREEVERQLKDAGIDPSRVVRDYVDDPDVSLF